MSSLELPVQRLPCSASERAAARRMASRLAALGFQTRIETFRAATSPTWVPLCGAALRAAGAALVAAGVGPAAAGCAAVAALAAVWPSGVESIMRLIPGLGGRSGNVVARVPPRTRTADPPVVVVAHLDTHPTSGAPLGRPHQQATRASLALLAGLVVYTVLTGNTPPRVLPAMVAAEAIVAILWMTRRELAGAEEPGDNATGVGALERTAELLASEPPVREVWLVATGAAMSGGAGMSAFLATHRGTAKRAWVVELDALGDGELVLSPARRRVPSSSTPAACVRAVAGAAIDSGDVIDVRRRRRPHSDAAVAFRRGTAALTITAGLRASAASEHGEGANAERAARIVARLARTTL